MDCIDLPVGRILGVVGVIGVVDLHGLYSGSRGHSLPARSHNLHGMFSCCVKLNTAI